MNRHANDPFAAPDPRQADTAPELDLRKLLEAGLRNWRFMAFATLVGLILALAQVAVTTRLYTAVLDIDVGRSAESVTFQEFSGVTTAVPLADVETELQVLRSEQIAVRTVRALQLHRNQTFLTNSQSGVGLIVRFLRTQAASGVAAVRGFLAEPIPQLPEPELTAEELENAQIEQAALRLRGIMTASSVRGSRVLQVRVTTASPELSARIANGVARAYIEDKLEASDEAAQRAISWLRERRDQLREQSDRLVQIAEQFRAQNNLIGVDIDRTNDVEFERLTQGLAAARAELVELEARDRRLSEIVLNNDTTAVVRETATQGITSELRSRYLEVLRAYNSLASSLGDDHAQTQRRLRELREIEGLMFEEIRRSAQLVRDDIRSTRERVVSLEVALAEVAERVGTDQAVIAELRQLDRNAETALALFTSFQQRFQEASQRQEIPASQARVLNSARPPAQPSSPNVMLILATGTILGFLLSVAIVTYREWRDDRVRTEDQVRDGLGLEFLGGLPILKGTAKVADPASTDTLSDQRLVTHMPEIMTYAADKPLSSFAETLRTGKISLTLRQAGAGRGTRMGFVSAFPSEGKTTTAANFANLLAQQGARVILIDADLRNPGLSRALGRPFELGLVDILLNRKDWREVRHVVPETGLHVIPNSKTRAAYTAELIGGGAMTALLDKLNHEYEFVVLDLPPLAPVVDARAVLDRLDGVFFVIKWGSTQNQVLQQILRADPRLREKCFGAYLNMFDPKKARAYGSGPGYGYYRKYYNRYYQDA